MVTKADADRQLRALGTTKRHTLVRTVVQRLRNGDSVRGIAADLQGTISRNLIRKYKQWDADKKLTFLFEIEPDIARLDKHISDRQTGSADDLDAPENKDGFYKRFLEITSNLPRNVGWHIEELEAIGFTVAQGLEFLKERDTFAYKQSPQFWPRQDFQRYIAMYYLLEFSRQEKERSSGAPQYLIEWAATAYADALINDDQDKMDAVTSIFRYQIWRGMEYNQAWEDSRNGLSSFLRTVRLLLESPLGE